MIVKITVEKVSDGKADDGTSEMQVDFVFQGFVLENIALMSKLDLIRGKAIDLVAFVQEVANG